MLDTCEKKQELLDEQDANTMHVSEILQRRAEDLEKQAKYIQVL